MTDIPLARCLRVHLNSESGEWKEWGVLISDPAVMCYAEFGHTAILSTRAEGPADIDFCGMQWQISELIDKTGYPKWWDPHANQSRM